MYNLGMVTTQIERLIGEHLEPIAKSLRDLESKLSRFAVALRHEANPAIVFEPGFDRHGQLVRYRELGAGPACDRAVDAFQKIEYGMEDPINESIKCYGALGVSKRLISDALLINRAKSAFKATMQPVARKRVRVTVKNALGEPTVALKNLSNVVLRRIQKSSINILAAYREIPILEETPYSIQLMQTRTRSVPRKTAAELLNLLADREDSLAAADRDRLEALDPNEYLVSPKERYPRMRAHVFYRRRDPEGDPAREIVMAELPVLFPIRARVRPPEVTRPAIRQRSRKHPTSYIEHEEYVKTLHFRRMQPGHRQYAGK